MLSCFIKYYHCKYTVFISRHTHKHIITYIMLWWSAFRKSSSIVNIDYLKNGKKLPDTYRTVRLKKGSTDQKQGIVLTLWTCNITNMPNTTLCMFSLPPDLPLCTPLCLCQGVIAELWAIINMQQCQRVLNLGKIKYSAFKSLVLQHKAGSFPS